LKIITGFRYTTNTFSYSLHIRHFCIQQLLQVQLALGVNNSISAFSVSLIRRVCAVHYSFLRWLWKQRAAFVSYLLNADKKEGTAILAAQGPFILATHSHQSGCSVQFPIRVCSLTPGGRI